MSEKLLSLARKCGAIRFLRNLTSEPPSYVRFTDDQLTAFAAAIREEERGNLMNERESQEHVHLAVPSGDVPAAFTVDALEAA